MKPQYTYNIFPEYNPDIFWKTVGLLDGILPTNMQREFVEDPLGELLLVSYKEKQQQIRCVCDWEIGAVFVDSDICLNHIFGDEFSRNSITQGVESNEG